MLYELTGLLYEVYTQFLFAYNIPKRGWERDVLEISADFEEGGDICF